MRNPFTLIVAQGDEFCDRQQELKNLVAMGENRQNVVFYSPRRYGKTSLMLKARSILQNNGFAVAYADLYHISSEREFVTEFSTAIVKALGQGVQDKNAFVRQIQDFLKRIQITAEVTPTGMKYNLGLGPGLKIEVAIEDFLTGMAAYVEKSHQKVVVILDEFQQIAELREGKKIEAKLRAKIQLTHDISYFFVGSRYHMLKKMFGDKKRPFYKSARDYQLKEIAKEEFVPYIENTFGKSGKNCPYTLASKLYDLARGYPYYVQMLSQLLWDFTEETSTEADLERAFMLLIREIGQEFSGRWDTLSMAQRNLLKAMSRNPETSFYSKEFLEQSGLSAGGVQKAVKVLQESDLVEKVGSRYRLTDPIMIEWLNRSREDALSQ